MSNRRREIRAAIATALLNQTAAEARVYSSRTNTLTEDELPAIVVLSRSENIAADGYPASGWNSSLRRNAAIVVEGIVQALEDVDDQLDDLAAEIEDVLEPFIIPGLESAELRLTDAEIDVNYEGSLPIGAVRLTYQVTYQTTYRDTPNPYVIDGDEPIERSGAYPGGRVTPDGQTGTACPMPGATVTCDDITLDTYQPRIPPA
jgi:hypothetical protein